MPREVIERIRVPTLVLDGAQMPWLTSSANAVASVLPNAQRRTLAGQQHNVDPAAIAPAITEFFKN
jgi:hypothetical protein